MAMPEDRKSRIPQMEQVRERNKPVAVTEDGKKIFAYNTDGIPICNSNKKTASGGGRCQVTATMYNGRCRIHGGNARSGVLHHSVIHLRNSETMPSHLRGDMVRALSDEDYLSLKHEIALEDVKINQQKQALETGLGSKAWKRLYELADKLEYCLAEDPEKSEKVCEDLINCIRFGVKEREVWREIDVSLEVRRKLVETAHKREIQLKTMLKGDQAIALVTGVASACKENISKLCVQLETRYTFIDKDTGKEASKIDIAFKNSFLTDIGVALGQLIGKANHNTQNQIIKQED